VRVGPITSRTDGTLHTLLGAFTTFESRLGLFGARASCPRSRELPGDRVHPSRRRRGAWQRSPARGHGIAGEGNGRLRTRTTRWRPVFPRSGLQSAVGQRENCTKLRERAHPRRCRRGSGSSTTAGTLWAAMTRTPPDAACAQSADALVPPQRIWGPTCREQHEVTRGQERDRPLRFNHDPSLCGFLIQFQVLVHRARHQGGFDPLLYSLRA